MKLLIVTQAIDKNNPILGFFVRWVKEFSKKCEKVTVICLEKGENSLPENVKVLSLGKEKNIRSHLYIFSKFIFVYRFYKYIWQERKNYDAVFVHMNPIYVVLGGLFWKLQKKKIGLWYTHKNVDLKLRLAEKLSGVIFTAAKESFQLKTDKLKVIGHGIVVDEFKNPGNIKKDKSFTIISIGRITPIKNLDILIEAANILQNKGLEFRILLVGGPINKEDFKYLERLKRIISHYKLANKISFIGNIPHEKVKEYLWRSDLSVNLCPTGGVDKAILESMAAGLPVLVSNKAFADYFGVYASMLIFKEGDFNDLVSKTCYLINFNNIQKIKDFLIKSAKERADLNFLISEILTNFK